MSRQNEVLTPRVVRGANSAAILRLLRQHGAMSRADLARRTGLNEGSVSRITSELLDCRLLRVDGAESSTGGRPGMRLRLDERRIGIGVDIRRSQVRLAAVTMAGEILQELKVDTPSNPTGTLDAVRWGIRQIREKTRSLQIEGVGVSAGGIVNRETGVVEFGNLSSWIEVPIREALGNGLKMPVQVDNDVRLAAIAEFHYGHLAEVRTSKGLLFVTVDEGIGAGIVLDGELYSGPGHAAGEFGQMVIAQGGMPGELDRPGSFERLASCNALLDRYAHSSGKSARKVGSGHLAARVRKICQRAMQGERAARKALEQTCSCLGLGLANMIWGLNPDVVVVNSPMNEAWPILIAALRAQFPREKEVVNFRNLIVQPSSLAGNAAIIGAGASAFQQLFVAGELIGKAS